MLVASMKVRTPPYKMYLFIKLDLRTFIIPHIITTNNTIPIVPGLVPVLGPIILLFKELLIKSDKIEFVVARSKGLGCRKRWYTSCSKKGAIKIIELNKKEIIAIIKLLALRFQFPQYGSNNINSIVKKSTHKRALSTWDNNVNESPIPNHCHPFPSFMTIYNPYIAIGTKVIAKNSPSANLLYASRSR